MIYTTLNKIRACSPCPNGWAKLLRSLGKTSADDEPLSFIQILDSNGMDDTLWATKSTPEHDRVWRLFAVWCARSCQTPESDPRSIAAIDCAERYANGNSTDDELAAARSAEAAASAAAWSAAKGD